MGAMFCNGLAPIYRGAGGCGIFFRRLTGCFALYAVGDRNIAVNREAGIHAGTAGS